MVWFIDELIAWLTELRSATLITQLLTLVGIPSLIGLAFKCQSFVWTKKHKNSAAEAVRLESLLKEAQQQAANHLAEVKRLEEEAPETFLKHHAAEMRNLNEERAMVLAEDFLSKQTDALQTAFETRMDEAIRQSVNDGSSALLMAILWGHASLALNPQNNILKLLVDDLNDAVSSGSFSRVMDDDNRVERIEKYERLPKDRHWCRDQISTFCIYAAGIENSMIGPACRTNITPPAAITSVR